MGPNGLILGKVGENQEKNKKIKGFCKIIRRLLSSLEISEPNTCNHPTNQSLRSLGKQDLAPSEQMYWQRRFETMDACLHFRVFM
jgi:hypothetical protein